MLAGIQAKTINNNQIKRFHFYSYSKFELKISTIKVIKNQLKKQSSSDTKTQIVLVHELKELEEKDSEASTN